MHTDIFQLTGGQEDTKIIESRIIEILLSAGNQRSPLRPTELYNEGWMLRLILDWSERHAMFSHPLHFFKNARWCSEGLLASSFLPRFRGDPLAEAWTHADGVIGHFSVGNFGCGDISLADNAKQFVIVEAKLNSPLSTGTKNAPGFDQAARSVSCITEVLMRANRRPESLEKIGFLLLAPKLQLEKGVFSDLLSRDSVRGKVKERVRQYRGDKDAWYSDWFEPTLDAIEVRFVSWESLVDEAGQAYRAFYGKCLQFNRLSAPNGLTKDEDCRQISQFIKQSRPRRIVTSSANRSCDGLAAEMESEDFDEEESSQQESLRRIDQ